MIDDTAGTLLDTFTRARLFDLLLENIPAGFVVFDHDRLIVSFNPAAEKITGYSRRDAVSRRCHEIFRTDLCEADCPVFNNASGPQMDRQPTGKRLTLRAKGERQVPVVMTCATLKGDGIPVGGIVIFTDASDMMAIERHRKILISMFAHDLKAPLVIIDGFVQRMLQGKAGPVTRKQTDYLLTIDREIRRMGHYVHSFLDVLKMEAGETDISLKPCCLDKAVAELIDTFKIEAQDKGIDLIADIPKDIPVVKGDKDQIQRVIMNLLDNAIKFSPEGSRVTIRLYDRPDYLACEVSDSGPGISFDDMPFIFDPFYKSKHTIKEKGETGSGLGLAIVKNIVERHGGRVWAESEPGKGAVFTFTIPKVTVPREQVESGASN
ncbi:MAG: PAS domain-containing sensor histidine kinase [Desulfobacteraceae bacterium]|nr:PAS domain-containing sensor histidine kinase [Desulfobacteraceae bacterium]